MPLVPPSAAVPRAMKRSRLSLALLTAVWSPSLAPTSAQSTVSVYVPGYRSENWEDLAASVITSVSLSLFFIDFYFKVVSTINKAFFAIV